MTFRIRRDRIPFTCPNCPTKVWSRPSNRLVCGQCFIPLEPQIPAGYPQALDQARPNFPTVKPSEIPLDQLALPSQVRKLLDSISEPAPAEPDEVAVVRKPEKTTRPSYRERLTPETIAKADRIIEASLKYDAESGKERSGWRRDLAASINRHPSWVTNRIKHLCSYKKVE